jgi:hypothetical protein
VVVLWGRGGDMLECKYLKIKEKPCKSTGKIRVEKWCGYINAVVTRECELCVKKVVE